MVSPSPAALAQEPASTSDEGVLNGTVARGGFGKQTRGAEQLLEELAAAEAGKNGVGVGARGRLARRWAKIGGDYR
jgi:hypothetical protein